MYYIYSFELNDQPLLVQHFAMLCIEEYIFLAHMSIIKSINIVLYLIMKFKNGVKI